MAVVVGTAGWSLPRGCAARFDGEGTHLERYGRVLTGAEINSSFHKPHAARTYERWAASTPAAFRFAVKLPRAITHDKRLMDVDEPLQRFLDESAGLGDKRGPLLVQLPPSFVFDAAIVGRFLDTLRGRYEGSLACEPRHATWTAPDANTMLVEHRVARVAADPPRADADQMPGGWPGLVYYRWHGAPRVYWSSYDAAQIDGLAAQVRARHTAVDVWCIFDNTASGAACENALELQRRLSDSAG